MKRNWLVVAIWTMAIGVLFFRLRFGFDQTDESYYYATVKRFCQGDVPFVTDWYPAQFSAVLLYPFYYFYSLFVPTGEGIILAGRYVYLVIQVIVAFYAWWSFRKEKYGLATALLYIMCSRQNIPGLSYYNLYLTFCVVSILSMYNYYHSPKRNYVYWGLAGIGISISTVCMPFLAIGVAVLVLYMLKKKQFSEVAVYVLSIFCCAAIYMGFLLSKASIPEYIEGLEYVLSTSDYTDLTLWKKVSGTALSLGKVYVLAVPGVAYLLYRLIVINRESGRKVTVHFTDRDNLVFLISLVLCVISFGIWKTGAIYQQVTFLVIPYIIKDIINVVRGGQGFKMPLGVVMYFVGLMVALLFWMGSDTQASCLPLGMFFSVVGGVIVLLDEVSSKYYSAILVMLVLSATSSRVLGQCYRDAEIWKLNTVIAEGPAKGLITEKSDVEDYNRVIDSLNYISEETGLIGEEKSILFTKFLPWGYLATDCRNASFTAWRTTLSDERLEEYYQVHPEKYPDVVFVLDESIGETNGLSGGEHMNESNSRSGRLWEQICSGVHYNTDAGDVYCIAD